MDHDDIVYDVVCRIEDKLDKHLDEAKHHVGRGELVAWFTIIGGAVALALGI